MNRRIFLLVFALSIAGHSAPVSANFLTRCFMNAFHRLFKKRPMLLDAGETKSLAQSIGEKRLGARHITNGGGKVTVDGREYQLILLSPSIIEALPEGTVLYNYFTKLPVVKGVDEMNIYDTRFGVSGYGFLRGHSQEILPNRGNLSIVDGGDEAGRLALPPPKTDEPEN